MTADGVALAAIVILLFPMGYFLLASPAFLLVKLDIPPVTQLLGGMFSVHFLMLRVAAIIGVIAFATAGRPGFAVGIGVIAAFAFFGRDRFMRRWNALLSARDAGDTQAVRQLRRLHWSGMLTNAAVLIAVVASIPYVSS